MPTPHIQTYRSGRISLKKKCGRWGRARGRAWARPCRGSSLLQTSYGAKAQAGSLSLARWNCRIEVVIQARETTTIEKKLGGGAQRWSNFNCPHEVLAPYAEAHKDRIERMDILLRIDRISARRLYQNYGSTWRPSAPGLLGDLRGSSGTIYLGSVITALRPFSSRASVMSPP